MNCATTNAVFVNEKLSFRNGITSDIADHTPDAVKPPPGTSLSGYWHNGKWHAAPHTDRTQKTRKETPTAQLKQKPRKVQVHPH